MNGGKEHTVATSTRVSMAQKPSEALAGKKRKKKKKPDNDLVGKAPATSCQENILTALSSRITGDYFP